MYRDASLAVNTQAVPLEAALAQWAAGVTYGSRVGATEQGYLSLNYTAEDGGGVDESFRAMWPEYLDVLSEPLRKMPHGPDSDDHQHGTPFGKGISMGLVEASVQLDPDVISRIAKTKGGAHRRVVSPAARFAQRAWRWKATESYRTILPFDLFGKASASHGIED